MWAIVAAAGSGTRLKSQYLKPYHPLAGKTIIEHALSPLMSCAYIQKIIVALPPHDQVWATMSIAQDPKIQTVTGGAERYDSVMNALQAISDQAQPQDWVLVHDAARPCLQTSDLTRLIETLKDHPVGGLLAARVSDTVKESDEKQRVVATLARHTLWRALTPQMFRYEMLCHALQQVKSKNIAITDDAQAIEKLGHQPRLIEGRGDNIKVTHPEDIALAEFLITRRV